jgi:hypothetical protein
MADPDTDRAGKRETRNALSLERERNRIRTMRLAIALLGALLLLALIVTLIMNQ